MSRLEKQDRSVPTSSSETYHLKESCKNSDARYFLAVQRLRFRFSSGAASSFEATGTITGTPPINAHLSPSEQGCLKITGSAELP